MAGREAVLNAPHHKWRGNGYLFMLSGIWVPFKLSVGAPCAVFNRVVLIMLRLKRIRERKVGSCQFFFSQIQPHIDVRATWTADVYHRALDETMAEAGRAMEGLPNTYWSISAPILIRNLCEEMKIMVRSAPNCWRFFKIAQKPAWRNSLWGTSGRVHASKQVVEWYIINKANNKLEGILVQHMCTRTIQVNDDKWSGE